MPTDVGAAIGQAEIAIAARKSTREATALEHRGALALEMIADDLTRLHAEMRTIRYLFAGFVAQPRK